MTSVMWGRREGLNGLSSIVNEVAPIGGADHTESATIKIFYFIGCLGVRRKTRETNEELLLSNDSAASKSFRSGHCEAQRGLGLLSSTAGSKCCRLGCYYFEKEKIRDGIRTWGWSNLVDGSVIDWDEHNWCGGEGKIKTLVGDSLKCSFGRPAL